MSEPHREIAGKVVLLSGASGGIGRALAEAFCDGGVAEVIAVSRKPIASERRQIHPYELDVTNESAVAEAAREFAERVDILVNCSGANANSGLFVPPTLAQARLEMEVNYFGILNMVRAFAPAMQKRGHGTIVNILSMVSLVNIPRMATYCASKAAAWSLTQAIRGELHDKGIDVLAIFPSITDTAMSSHLAVPKLSPQKVAAATIDAIRMGIEDQHEGLIEEEIYAGLRSDPKRVERMMGQRR
jgi:NAD(P)-dependent dehydrogenase (short-subunit alcohol dehydrogenase family)